MRVRLVPEPVAISEVPQTANAPGIRPIMVIENGFQIATARTPAKPASTSRPPSPPRPAVTRLPEDLAQVSTLLSNSAISSRSREPAATSFLFAVNVEPGTAEDVRACRG